MARKITLSIAVFLMVFCLGLSRIATVSAALLVREQLAAPVQVLPAP